MKIVLLIMLSFLLSCSSQKSNLDLLMNIRSPYNCSHQISLDENGNCVIIGGYSSSLDNSIREDFKGFDKEYKSFKFKISNDDMLKIKSLLLKIDKNKIEKKFKDDAFRKELFLNDEKKIDVYARDSEIFNEIQDLIVSQSPNTIDLLCEKYR